MIWEESEIDFFFKFTTRLILKLPVICKMENYHHSVGKNDVQKSETDYFLTEESV